jgi:phosphinothricin acetyltransferase
MATAAAAPHTARTMSTMSTMIPRTPLQIRTARPDDAAAIAAIYAPIVSDTAISFELEAPDVNEMRRRITATLPLRPWLVGVDAQGAVCGYVYASPFRERAAYQWAVEVTAYVRSDCRGQGVGRQLYTRLFSVLAELGYVQAVAGITLPNDASVGLHEALGFEPATRYRHVGYKHGAWRDVGYWQKALQPLPASPTPPRAFNGLG